MSIPATMCAVRLTGYGGLDKLEYRTDLPVPRPEAGHVLVQVVAAGMNNTDINTRTGWYNSSVTSGTTAGGGQAGFGVAEGGLGDWSGDVIFPRIQGADVAGRIVAVGGEVEARRIGERVVCNPYVLDPDDQDGLDSARFLGADYDGGFAQFTVVPSENAVRIPDGVTLSDEAIATLPCSGGTAMNMLLMAQVGDDDLMLVTGASGGVGTFLIQIGKWLGAEVAAVASAAKRDAVLALGADSWIERQTDDLVGAALEASGGRKFSVVADVVGGDQFPDYLSLLRRGGRYVTAGAIAGPLVTLDLRTLYLKNLSFFGSTLYRRDTFPALMRALEEGGITPAVDTVRPLAEIHEAQSAFLEKRHVGSLVLRPPPLGDKA